MTKECCATCKYWGDHATKDDIWGYLVSQCHWLPPVPVVRASRQYEREHGGISIDPERIESHLPDTTENDFCGQWKEWVPAESAGT